jgi:hypothetical protein
VVETGLAAVEWPDEQRATYVAEHSHGWESHLATLRDHLSRQPGISSSR